LKKGDEGYFHYMVGGRLDKYTTYLQGTIDPLLYEARDLRNKLIHHKSGVTRESFGEMFSDGLNLTAAWMTG
jgi:hypothetical protein